MIAYTLEIPGRKHPICEDSSFGALVQTRTGERGGVYVIGDGLSGYNGLKASHYAVKSVGERIVEGIIKSGFSNITSIISKTIGSVNSELDSMTGDVRTTLDVVVVSEMNMPVFAHLGDSRIYSITDSLVHQLTSDETSGSSGPSNYLGEAFIYGSSIENRIRIGDVGKSDAIFMTTDGLRSRVTEQVVQKILLRYRDNPQLMLDELASEVTVPSSKLRELRSERLTSLYSLLEIEPASYEMELSKVIQAYQERQHDGLVAAVDGLFPFDDVTMIYIDLVDRVSQREIALNRLENVEIPGKMQERAELYRRVSELEQSCRVKDGTIELLESRLAAIELDRGMAVQGAQTLMQYLDKNDVALKAQNNGFRQIFGGLWRYMVNGVKGFKTFLDDE